ncbi:MAG: 4Fe-4S binding protein [Spirochaetes bacterium]|nr:4Fe-4S binding protein [Spirochaetota bacterium]
MHRILLTRLAQGHRTNRMPNVAPPLPDRFRGLPVLDAKACASGCRACEAACPTGAISARKGLHLDLGKCLFCTACTDACPTGAVRFTGDHRLAVSDRKDLRIDSGEGLVLAEAMGKELRRVLGRSLRLRVVSAGGCNGCEVDVNVLQTIVWDLSRFGIQYVASPRHADGMVICGPVTRNMDLAVRKTWAAIPEPKLAFAVGACAISGGPYAGQKEQLGGAAEVVPVDYFIPGCPPHPLTILDGFLRALGRMPDQKTARKA